jgi:hypothetical protein
MWRRRDVIQLMLSGAAMACGRAPSSNPSNTKTTGTEPGAPPRAYPRSRYNMQIFLRGGIDPAFTSDPKSRADVEPWVDVPISPNDMFDAGGNPFGPHLLPIKDYLHRFAIINNVLVATANHDTGTLQYIRMKTRVSPLMPSILDIIGEHRDHQPLATLSLGDMDPREYTGGRFGGNIVMSGGPDVLDELLKADPVELKVLARVQRQQADTLVRNASDRDAATQTATNLRQSADLIDRLPAAKPLQIEEWSKTKKTQNLARELQRALWAIENDLASCIYLRAPGFNWDTHVMNGKSQTANSEGFFTMFAKFLHALDERTNKWGRLSDNISLAFGSEIGRFPRINGLEGKDHFPEAPYFLFGRPFRPGVYGRSGRKMDGLPMSFASGQPIKNGRLPGLDNVGATWLTAAGIDPKLYGYEADVLPFLLETKPHA